MIWLVFIGLAVWYCKLLSTQFIEPHISYGDPIDIRFFGAVGDGCVDDTLAIKTAFYESKIVIFPRGEYLVTSSIELR